MWRYQSTGEISVTRICHKLKNKKEYDNEERREGLE
jgi:hypothetical protein